MPIQRRVPTAAEQEAREQQKKDDAVIHYWQVAAFRDLFYRNKKTTEFLLALRQHCHYDAGTTALVREIAEAIGMTYKNTCTMLEALEYTGIGKTEGRRPTLPDDKPFDRFYWKGDLHELTARFIESEDERFAKEQLK